MRLPRTVGRAPGSYSGRNRPLRVIAASRSMPHTGPVPRRIVFVAYPRITALDLVGPHEVFTAAGQVAALHRP